MSAPNEGHRRYSNEVDVYSKAEIYYASGANSARRDAKHRTFSARIATPPLDPADVRQRRFSSDDSSAGIGRKFLIPVESTLEALLAREDTDKNSQITIDDAGPKVCLLLESCLTGIADKWF